MPIKICPNCNQRYTVSFDTTDYIHNCNSGNLVLDQEDVVVTGNWEDDSGSGNVSAQQVLRQGVENELQGHNAQIEDRKDKEETTRRGVRASTHRQRQKLTYINLKEDRLE